MPYFIVRIDNRHISPQLWRVHCEDLEKKYDVITGVYHISRGPGRNRINVYNICIYKHSACFCLNPLKCRTTRCKCLVKNQLAFKYFVYDFVVKVMSLSWKYIYIYSYLILCNGVFHFPIAKKLYRYALQWSTYSHSLYLKAFNRTSFGHFVFGVLTPWYFNTLRKI